MTPIVFERQLHFPRPRVWQALTAHNCLAAWLGDPGTVAAREEPLRLRHAASGRSGETIEWTLELAANGTHLRLVHSGVEGRLQRALLRLRWHWRLHRLEKLLPRVTERGLIPKPTKYIAPALESPWATVDLP